MITFDDNRGKSASSCFVETAKKQVTAVLSDLMFTVKIQEAAKRAGLDVKFVKSQADALAQLRRGASLFVLDLNDRNTDPLGTIAAIRGSAEGATVPLLGYVSHVQVELRQAAEAAGCSRVVARSVFVERLPSLLEDMMKQDGTSGAQDN